MKDTITRLLADARAALDEIDQRTASMSATEHDNLVMARAALDLHDAVKKAENALAGISTALEISDL